jgi:hypothetical protein
MDGSIREFWDGLYRLMKKAFELTEEPFTLFGTTDLLLAQNTVTGLAWTIQNGPVYLLETLRSVGRLDSRLDYSDDQILKDLIAFAFDLRQVLAPEGLTEAARCVGELCSVRSRPVRIAAANGGCATDAVLAITLRLVEAMQDCLGYSWFLQFVLEQLPKDVEPDGSIIGMVVREAVRARELESSGSEYPGFTKAREFAVHDLNVSEIADWTPCFERIRAMPKLLLRYHRQDLFSIVEPMRSLFRGFKISRVIAELDLEYSKAARIRMREGIPLRGKASVTSGAPGLELKKESQAIACLVEHPDWTDTRIAEEVGVHRSTLYTWNTFQLAKSARKAEKKRHRRGWKNNQGEMDAWDGDN